MKNNKKKLKKENVVFEQNQSPECCIQVACEYDMFRFRKSSSGNVTV